MSREKQNATEALKRLERYLHNDRPGLAQLCEVARYVATLRRSKAENTARIELLEAEILTQRKANLAAEKALPELRRDLESAQARCRQAEMALQRWIAEEQRRESPEQNELPDPPADLDLDARVIALGKQLYHFMPKAPPLIHAGACPLLYIGHFIKDFTWDEYTHLGMFVAFLTLATTFRVSFTSVDGRRSLKRLEAGCRTDQQEYRTWVWISKWVDWSKSAKQGLRKPGKIWD